MPQIPRFDDQVNLHPGGAAQASPGAFAAVGDAIRRVGDEQTDILTSFLARRTEAARAADAAHHSTEATKTLDDLEFKWSKVPNREEAQAGFDKDAAQMRQQLLDGIKDPYVQSHVSQNFDQQAAVRRHTTANAAFQLESSTRRGTLDTDLNTLSNAAASASSDVLRAQLVDQGVASIKGAAAGGWIDPETGAKAELKFKSDVQEVQARKLMNSAIDGEDGAAAHDLAQRLSDPHDFPGLLPERREILHTRLEGLGDRLDRSRWRARRTRMRSRTATCAGCRRSMRPSCWGRSAPASRSATATSSIWRIPSRSARAGCRR
jgi:hypothetical protein